MKQFWTAVGIGAAVLGAVVAFALVPGHGGASAAPEAEPTSHPPADVTACRNFELGVATAKLDKALGNLTESLEFERAGHDGGLGFHDWLDADPVSESLLATARAGEAAARTPQLSDEGFEVFRDVVVAASDLEVSAVSGSRLMTGEVADDVAALSSGLASARGFCG